MKALVAFAAAAMLLAPLLRAQDSDMQRRPDEKESEIARLRAQLVAQQQENDRRFDELVGAVRVLQQGRIASRRSMEILVSEVQP